MSRILDRNTFPVVQNVAANQIIVLDNFVTVGPKLGSIWNVNQVNILSNLNVIAGGSFAVKYEILLDGNSMFTTFAYPGAFPNGNVYSYNSNVDSLILYPGQQLTLRQTLDNSNNPGPVNIGQGQTSVSILGTIHA